MGKPADKSSQAGVPDLQANVRHTIISIEEHLCSGFDPQLGQKTARRKTGNLPEGPIEVIPAHIGHSGHFFERDVFVQTLAEGAYHPLYGAFVHIYRIRTFGLKDF
jgi:hypothetical protein